VSDLTESYAVCQRAARQAASNFYFSFLLLPPEKRRGMWALYAFLRHVDDLADDTSCDIPGRQAALVELRKQLDEALAGSSSEPILRALADTVRRYQIPTAYLTAAIDGVEMDLSGVRFETYDDLELYCYRVASVVGLACIHIWGFRGAEAVEPARKCGLAFQLTNILRDVREDAEHGRVYLPCADLRQFGYAPNDLLQGEIDERFHRLMQFEIARAEQLYAAAAPLEGYLDRDGRRVFRAMSDTYRKLLEKIKRRPTDVFRHRIRLNRWEKLRIGATAFFAARKHNEPRNGREHGNE
jgi:15-cis-phytoene synthase